LRANFYLGKLLRLHSMPQPIYGKKEPLGKGLDQTLAPGPAPGLEPKGPAVLGGKVALGQRPGVQW